MPAFASYDGTEIGYRVLGDGLPLVCLPGGPGRGRRRAHRGTGPRRPRAAGGRAPAFMMHSSHSEVVLASVSANHSEVVLAAPAC